MARVVVLGCGLMGPIIVRDLAVRDGHSVTVVDSRSEASESIKDIPQTSFVRADLAEIQRSSRFLQEADLVVGALPGAMGFMALRRLLESGVKRIVDISFMPEDPGELTSLAQLQEAVVAVDCGVAPGLSHMMATRLVNRMPKPESIEILVGGLPLRRRWPFEYVSVFSPRDVLEEYTRPARIKVGGLMLEREALSDVELVDFPETGTLEAFLTDGLRSLLFTMGVPNMKEKTLRYPGHAERMRLLRDSGFFSADFIEVGGSTVRPLDLTARLLEKAWRFEPGEQDLTALRVIVSGKDEKGKGVSLTCEMVDVVEAQARFTSMARTTGFTCTAVCRALLNDEWTSSGIIYPELLGNNPTLLDGVLADLDDRGIRVRFTAEYYD